MFKTIAASWLFIVGSAQFFFSPPSMNLLENSFLKESEWPNVKIYFNHQLELKFFKYDYFTHKLEPYMDMHVVQLVDAGQNLKKVDMWLDIPDHGFTHIM